jgi:hypothetical protein
MRSKYTAEMLTPIVRESFSIAEVIRRLGLRETGGSHKNIKQRILACGLDTSHFLGKRRNQGSTKKGGPAKKTPEELLVLGRADQPYASRRRIRRALLESGVPHQCALCGQINEWNGKPLVLQIDHINGHGYDNRSENVRFLCPNCHSQTDTYGSKNKLALVTEWQT